MKVPNLKYIRTSKGLTQKDLADMLHTDTTLVSRWESGTFSISPHSLRELCKVLNVTAQDLGVTPPIHGEDTESDENLLMNAAAALKNPHLIPFLRWKYPQVPFLERCGQVYPAAVFPAPNDQLENLEFVLVDGLDKTMLPDQDKNQGDPQFREFVERLGRDLQNRPTYTMKGLLTEENRVGMTCGMGMYFECLDTCDSLEWELLSRNQYLTRSDMRAFRSFETHLPLCSALHAKVADPVRNGRYRSVAIAISTLVAFNDEGTLRLWIKKRSAKVAVHASIFHVIPSFMFQPATEYYDNEFSISHNIFREYLEEMFNRKEPWAGDWRSFYSDPVFLFLHDLLNTGRLRCI